MKLSVFFCFFQAAVETSVFSATTIAYDGQLYGNETVQALQEALEEAESAVAPAAATWDAGEILVVDGGDSVLGQSPALKPIGPSMDIAEIPPYVPKEENEKTVRLDS
jgi:hypothetical protein